MIKIILILLSSFALSSYADSKKEILNKVEQTRAPWNEFEFVAKLKNPQIGSKKQETYGVKFKDGTKTLVSFKKPRKQKGNLLLMVGDSLWFYVKDTSRPTRITPIQRLSGSVSYGDLTRLGWSQDYTIQDYKQRAGKHYFTLKAKGKGATYQKITLKANERYEAEIAEVYLRSGKHYKTMEFLKYETIKGENMNTKIKFTDHLNGEGVTYMSLSRVSPKDIPNRYFIKGALNELSNELR